MKTTVHLFKITVNIQCLAWPPTLTHARRCSLITKLSKALS